MKLRVKKFIKKIVAIYVSHFPIIFNGYWIYMNPKNIQLVPPMLLGKYEFGMTNLIKRVVRKDWIVCEVGAYIGDHTPLFSRLVGDHGRVISVEPQSSHFKLLLKNIALNKLTNVIPVKAAISDSEGISTMYIPLEFTIDGRIYEVSDQIRKKQKTTSKTIDNLLKQYKSVNLIKMDIQGWEERAINGARKTILKNPKLILIIELWPKGLIEAGTNPLKLLEDLRKMKLKIYKINDDTGKIKRETDFIKLIDKLNKGPEGFIDLICSKKSLFPKNIQASN